MIKTVIRTRDDMIMAFDDAGEQLPLYQGRYKEVRERILRDATENTVFNHWFGYSLEPLAVSGREF